MTLYFLSGIQKRFGNLKALDIEQLSLSQNTVCALLGANGSGKTTLLHILALLLPPTSGTIRFLGEPVNWRQNRLLRLRRKVVLVDQHPIMFSTTVIKNVAYGLKVRGESRSMQNRCAMECLDRVGMRDFADRPAHRLSGGETQRVAIARALACRPEVLLLDEPTAGVDIENQAVIENIIRDIVRKKQMSIVFSSHNPLQAERLAKEKIYLGTGHLNSPASENRFPASVCQQNRELASVMQPLIDQQMTTPYRLNGSFISIDPEKIRLYTDAPGNFGLQRDRFLARVLQMNIESDRIRVVLDVGGHAKGSDKLDGGILLSALMGIGDVRHAGMVPGDVAQFALDPDAVRIEKIEN